MTTILVERAFAMSKLSAEYCYLFLLGLQEYLWRVLWIVNRCPHQLESYLDIQHITEVIPFCSGFHLSTTFNPDICYKTRHPQALVLPLLKSIKPLLQSLKLYSLQK